MCLDLRMFRYLFWKTSQKSRGRACLICMLTHGWLMCCFSDKCQCVTLMFVSVKEKEDAHGDPEIQPMKEDDITFGEYRWESSDLTLDLWPLRRLTPPHQTPRSETESRRELLLHDVTFIFSSDGSDPVCSAVGGLMRILWDSIRFSSPERSASVNLMIQQCIYCIRI